MAETASQHAPDPREFTDASPNPARDTELAMLGDALQDHGITRVVVRYEGYSDEGGVDEVTVEPEGARLPDWIDAWLCKLAEGYFPEGYANDAGGHGSLTVYPASGLAELEHFDRSEGTEAMEAGAAPLPRRLRQRLSRLGVTRVTATFDGYGDSGQIEDLTAEPDNVAIDDGLRSELEDFLLDQLPGGWEINEGSYGDFTVDVASGTVEADASWRTEEESEARLTRWGWRK
jgi:hypothetical protein